MNNNISRLKDIALAFGDIKDDVVFVGGATVVASEIFCPSLAS